MIYTREWKLLSKNFLAILMLVALVFTNVVTVRAGTVPNMRKGNPLECSVSTGQLTVSITGAKVLHVEETGYYSATVSGGSGKYSYLFYATLTPRSQYPPYVFVPNVMPKSVTENFGSANPVGYNFTVPGNYIVGVIVTDEQTGAQGEASMLVNVVQQHKVSPFRL
jgi:hypothetical protein